MGTISIKLPDVGEGVTEAELVEWHVKVGDFVREDDILADVMTDKATVEIPSICDGTVTWVGGEVGDTLAVGTKIVRIESLEADTPSVQPPEPVLAEPEKKEPKPPADENEKPLAAPAVRLRAQEAGIDLNEISGTGPDNHITHADLDKILTGRGAGSKDSKPQRDASIREIKITGLRRKIADRMATANSHIPHITIIEEVDVTEIESLRAKLNEENPGRAKLTLLPFILSALSKAVREYPQMNATFDDDAEVVKQFGGVHAGIATMTEKGLTVPVVRHAEALNIREMAAEIVRLAKAARNGEATRDELSGSTITVTSLGPLGAVATTPIINYPEVAIVGINKIAMRPMWNGSEFIPRKMMNLSCSFDHRVIDGWDAAVFVQKLKSLLETPALIFMPD